MFEDINELSVKPEVGNSTKPLLCNRLFMYKVVSAFNENEVWATGFYSKEKAQYRIDEGYYHRFMYDKDKKLIVKQY